MKKRPGHLKYKLFRLQQQLAITSREAKTIGVLLCFLLIGIILTEIQKHQPAFSGDIYAETDSLFLQATTSLKKADELLQADSSLAPDQPPDTTKSHPSDALLEFFKPVFPVNINTANQSELEQLPRIGPKMAERIITFRNTHGRFQKTSDLMKVKGIGEKTFAQFSDKVTVE